MTANGNGLPPHTIEGRLEYLTSCVETLLTVAQQILGRTDGGLAEIKAGLENASARRTKEWYSVAEAAAELECKPGTVRKWCLYGRIRAKKRLSGHSIANDWEIHRDELDYYRNHGLRPLRLVAEQ